MISMNEDTMESDTHQICYEDREYALSMAREKKFQVALWFTPEANFDIQCFLWCSNNGSLPKHASDANDEIVSALVSYNRI